MQSAGVTQQVPVVTSEPHRAPVSTWEHDAPPPQSDAVVQGSVPIPHWPAMLAAIPFCLRTQ
ncbi:MAG: hypothetical protein ACRENC_17640 [Gemmatimonadaceae bacterium]